MKTLKFGGQFAMSVVVYLVIFLMLSCGSSPQQGQSASSYYNRGNDYYRKGNFDRAIEEYSKAISLNPNISLAWNNRGLAYQHKGNLEKAIADYNKSIDLDPKNALPWNNRGNAYFLKNEIDQAIADYDKAIDLNREWDSAFINRGNAYSSRGEIDLAIEDYNRALAINPENPMNWWNNRGDAYRKKGELDKAIADFDRAIALNPKDDGPWNNRGICYFDKGDLDQAIRDLSKSIELNPKDGEVWSNRGVVYRDKGDLNKAITDSNKAVSLSPNSAVVWSNRGDVYFVNNQFDKAIADYNKALTLNPNAFSAWYSLANAYQAKGDYAKAINAFKLAIEAADKSSDITDIFFVSWLFGGQLYENLPFPFPGDYYDEQDKQYLEFFLDAIGRSVKKADKVRFTLGTRGTDIMMGLLFQYYAGVDLEACFGSAANAFVFSEGLRSRGFLEQMGTEAALKLPGIAPTDVKKVRDLINEIGNYQVLLAGLDPQKDADKYATTGSSLTRAEGALATLDAQITTKVPHYAELRYPKIADLSQARAFCGNDRVILEYVIWDSSVEFKPPVGSSFINSNKERPSINSYCLVITKDGITPIRLDPNVNYSGLVETLKGKVENLNAESTFEAERNALYNALIEPILKHIPVNINSILIVPDGNLAFLPFDILRENPGSQSLGEKYSISLSPSVSCSILAKQNEVRLSEPIIAFGGAWYDRDPSKNRPSANAALDNEMRLAALERRQAAYRGLGVQGTGGKPEAVDFFNALRWNYLPGTVAEVQGLERLASSTPRIVLGKDTSESMVKRLSNDGTFLNYPIIHFACHGYLNDSLTPQAALVFSEVSDLLRNESSEDGYLSIEEIALLQLRARMVMLSACQTGLGWLKRGDGMSGLVRAFMTAGANNVGVSLWEISDDATVEFMWNVYRKVIQQGKTFRDSYREVKEEFRKRPDWNHPYYWAAFVLYE